MSAPNQRVVAARQRAADARARLAATIAQIHAKFEPKALVREAIDDLRDSAGAFAEEAVSAVRARPAVTAAVAAGLGLFLARKPILRGAKRFSTDEETPDAPDGSVTE